MNRDQRIRFLYQFRFLQDKSIGSMKFFQNNDCGGSGQYFLRISVIILCTIGWSWNIYCQQQFQNTFFYLDPYDLNPAYIGTDGKIALTARYRQQWAGLEGSPGFARIGVHVPMHDYDSGFGLKIGSESIGAIRDIAVTASGNYYFETVFGALSAGIRGGLQNKTIDGSGLLSATGIYGTDQMDHRDDHLFEGLVNDFFPVLGIGLEFFSNKFEIGTVFDYYPVVSKRIDKFSWKNQPMITFHGKYYLPLVPDFRMEAFWSLKSDLVQWQNDAGMLAEWRDQFFTAFSLKGFSRLIPDVLSISAGAYLGNSISMAYNYELGFSSLNQWESGSHEIIVRWRIDSFFGAKKKEPIIHSPRFYE